MLWNTLSISCIANKSSSDILSRVSPVCLTIALIVCTSNESGIVSFSFDRTSQQVAHASILPSEVRIYDGIIEESTLTNVTSCGEVKNW